MPQQPLIINNWQNAIADSPHLGFARMSCVEVDSFQGSFRPGKKPVTAFHTAYAQTFTADASTDICTAAGGTLGNTGTAVTLTTTGTLPAGLSTGTNYFIIKLSATTFKLATNITNANASTAIDITDAGTGTHTVTTVNPGTILHQVTDPRTGNVFAQDSNARVWFSTGSTFQLVNGNTITNGAGNGIAILRTSDGNATYLFAFRNGSVDVVNVFGTSDYSAPTWSNAWKSLNSGAGSGNSHYALNGQDGLIYFTDDRYVGSIRENAGQVFDPSNAATYTFNASALDLPLGSLTYWLEELGTNLLISVSNSDKVYPWDRVSDSFSLPLPLPEYGGNKMKNIGNIVYILAGTHGNIYQTQGTYVRLFKTIPEYLSNNSSTPQSNPITWGGIERVLGNLLVGVSTNGTGSTGNAGAYMFMPDGRFVIDNIPSTGAIVPTSFLATNEFYRMGYSGGADTMDASRYNDTTSAVQSQFYRVADKISKAKYSRLELEIAKPVAGSVRIGYRTNILQATSFTTLSTFTTTTDDVSYTADIGLTDIENIQIEVTTSAPDIMEVRLYP